MPIFVTFVTIITITLRLSRASAVASAMHHALEMLMIEMLPHYAF